MACYLMHIDCTDRFSLTAQKQTPRMTKNKINQIKERNKTSYKNNTYGKTESLDTIK